MHLFYKRELYKYLILNDTNFYSFLHEKRVGLLELRLKLVGL